MQRALVGALGGFLLPRCPTRKHAQCLVAPAWVLTDSSSVRLLAPSQCSYELGVLALPRLKDFPRDAEEAGYALFRYAPPSQDSRFT